FVAQNGLVLKFGEVLGIGVLVGGDEAKIAVLGKTEQDRRQEGALRVRLLELLTHAIGFIEIVGQVQGSNQAFMNLLHALGQGFLIEKLIVGIGRFAWLFDELLGISHLEEYLAAAL